MKEQTQGQQRDLQNAENKIRELQQDGKQLLNQLHLVQEELERYYLENQQLKINQKPEEAVHYGAAERVKQELAYCLGARMIAQSRSLAGCLGMPFALLAEVRRFRQREANSQCAALPPIASYNDAHEAEHVRKHLSYRLGACMLAHSKSLSGWLTMPWALYAENKAFQKKQGER